MIGYIYMIKNKENGKVYIGKTKRDYRTRIMTHFSEAFRNEDKCKLHIDIRLYGEKCFEAKVLEKVDIKDYEEFMEKLNSLENEYMEKFDSIQNGYNMNKNRYKTTIFIDTSAIDKVKANETIENVKKYNLVKKKRKVLMYDRNGIIQKTFDRLVDASRELDVNKSTIANCLSGRRLHAKGFIFRYEGDKLDMEEYKDEPFIIRKRKTDYTNIIK